MKLIEIQNLKKYFGKTKAVDGISFGVDEGEIFGFLGPNGAGKTTTISAMMGFTKPTEGHIKIMGKDSWVDRTDLKNDIGYISADFKYYPNLTGREHINLYKSIRSKSTSIATKLIDDFDFNADTKVGKLSTGNKQKLGIILSFMFEPKLLIFDEPTRGLDPISQKTFYEYIVEMNKKGSTIFMSSHNLSEVQKYCNHIGIIKKGKLLTVESLDTLQAKQLRKIKLSLSDSSHNLDLKTPGIKDVELVNMGQFSFTFEGNLNELMQELSQKRIVDIEIGHSDLEEIFDKYYK